MNNAPLSSSPDSEPANVLVDASDLVVMRSDVALTRPLSFAVQAGTLVRLVGPNGSGKSTLLRLLSGLRPAPEGRLGWREEPPSIGWLGHGDGLTPALTVAENMAFRAGLHGRAVGPMSSAAADVRAALGIAALADRQVRHLSAGQRRRTALACVAVSGAELWLLDEPLTALDTHGRAQAEALMAGHLGAGGAIVAATHGGLDLPGAVTLDLGAEA